MRMVEQSRQTCRKRSYLGITAHYIDDEFKLHDRVLVIKHMPSQIQHTASNIRAEVVNCLRRFKMLSDNEERKLIFVTDRGPNIVAALREYNRLNCIEHVLNNITEELYKEAAVKLVVSNCSKLVTLFKNSSLNNQLPQTFKAAADTRWNTVYYMLKSIIPSYESAYTLLENRGKEEEMSVIDQININEISALVDFFKPFEQMTMVLQGSRKPSLCFVQPWVVALKKHMLLSNKDHHIVAALKQAFSVNQKLIQLLNNKAVDNYHLIATFLHPL